MTSPTAPGKKTCSVAGCGRPHKARGWCERHRQLARYREDPERFRKKARAWAASHPKKKALWASRWRASNIERIRKYQRDYARSNRVRLYAQARALASKKAKERRVELLARRAPCPECGDAFRPWADSKSGDVKTALVRRDRCVPCSKKRLRKTRSKLARKASATLSDSYVRNVLRWSHRGLRTVPPVLIEAKRAQLQLHRLVNRKEKH